MRTLAAVALLVALAACGANQAAAPGPLAPLSPDAPAADVYARAMELVRTAAVAPATGRYAGPFTPQVGPSHALYQACAGERAFDMIWWEFPTPAKPRRLKTPAGDYVVVTLVAANAEVVYSFAVSTTRPGCAMLGRARKLEDSSSFITQGPHDLVAVLMADTALGAAADLERADRASITPPIRQVALGYLEAHREMDVSRARLELSPCSETAGGC